MKLYLPFLLLLSIVAAPSAAAPRKMLFFFFVAGGRAASHTREEMQAMQKAHLDNLDRLYKAGLLKLAGPCADPDKRRRGIVLIDVPSAKELEKHFAEDPFVREGYLKIEPLPVRVELLEVGPPGEGITQHSIALIQGDGETDKTKFDTKVLRSLPSDQRPPIVLSATDPGSIRAVLFFGSAKLEEVQARLRDLKPVKDGKLRATVFGQWMGKGMLPADSVEQPNKTGG